VITGSRSKARASEKQPPSITSLTTSLPTDLMTTSTRERALGGGWHHRNPRPASIGTGGRLRSESPADFVGMRSAGLKAAPEFTYSHSSKCSLSMMHTRTRHRPATPGSRPCRSNSASVPPVWSVRCRHRVGACAGNRAVLSSMFGRRSLRCSVRI
jgi:hypothetical protein